jgi:hypothetical protein
MYDPAHPQQFQEGVINTRAVRKPKCATRAQVIEEEKLLFLFISIS